MERFYKPKLLAALLLLITTAAFAQIPNAGFENWTSNSCLIFNTYNDANGWGDLNGSTCPTNDFTVQKATGAANVHSGSAALLLYSQYISIANATAPGICVTGTINTSTQAVQGGFPQTNRPDKFIGWFKYAPVAPDTFNLSVNVYSGATSVSVPMGSGSATGSTAVSSWTKFIANITYTSSAPSDSAQITLLCSAGANGQSGTKMYIDDLALISCAGFGAASTVVKDTCNTGTGAITLGTPVNGTAPYTYNWSNGSTATSISGLAAGTYKVTITDDNTCTALDSIIVGTTNLPFTLTGTNGITSCLSNTGTVSVAASGGHSPYTYLWSNGSTVTPVNNLGPSDYTVTVTDAHGCTTALTDTVSTASGPRAADTVSNVLCFGNTTGSVTVTVTGGTAPVTYAWSNTATTLSLSGVPAGPYTLTITDANNCSFQLSATVTQPASALSVTSSSTNLLCNGLNTGSATVNATGGTPPYTYAWTGSSNDTDVLSNLAAGSYTVTVTDTNQCSATASYTITQPTALTALVNVTNASSATAGDGSAFVVVTGGTGSYTYLWNTSNNQDTITHLSAATYCVTVTDSNFCSATACDSVGYSVGINTITSAVIKIYPNPANNQLTIETNAADGKFLFSVYGLDGKLVDQFSVAGEKTTVILDHLADGFYTYQLKDAVSGSLNYGKLEILR